MGDIPDDEARLEEMFQDDHIREHVIMMYDSTNNCILTTIKEEDR